MQPAYYKRGATGSGADNDTDPTVLAYEALGAGSDAPGGGTSSGGLLVDGTRPIVFLHGLFARGAQLRGLAQAVTAGAPQTCALLPDLLGHGDSPALPEHADLATVARAFLSWLDALAIDGQVPIVAHSMGGRVALRARGLAPGRVGPLVCIDTPAGNLQARRSPLAPFIKAWLGAPERAPSREALLAPFNKIMVGAGLLRWVSGQTVELPKGGFGWRSDRQAMAGYRWTTMGEDLWPIVASLAPGELTVIAPQRSVYVRPEDRETYAGFGVEVTVEPKGTHEMYNALAADKLEIVRRALGLESGPGPDPAASPS